MKIHKANRLLMMPLLALLLSGVAVKAQEEMWDKTSSGKEPAGIQWFKEAKFGLFIHWGLYSQLGGVWKGKRFYGSGEWLMSQGKIPAADYAAAAAAFDPTHFNADAWAALAREAGVKYLVITAKHHEGFAMYDTKVSDFSIVKATPYKHDPMKDLAEATRKQGIKFGFYYSQFLDWHEPNGGGNKWDFEEAKKDYQLYYRTKAIPQLKELLTGYGPLGIVWFDMPGGLTHEQTAQLVDSLHRLQPTALFSSRVGQGLGDYKDFGDSELPPAPISGAWESIYTNNDTWGYIAHDQDFKSPQEIVRLLARVASRGGNLMLNIGPDGKGDIPAYAADYLRETGRWLRINGESIYGTTAGFIPPQPWGVTTAKPGKLYLLVFDEPQDRRLLVPSFAEKVSRVYTLDGRQVLVWRKQQGDLVVDLPAEKRGIDRAARVFVIEYAGMPPAYDSVAPVTISANYAENTIEAVHAVVKGNTKVRSITHSYYYGDWKHATCVTSMKDTGDGAIFRVRVTEPGDYRIILEYACTGAGKQEGEIDFNGSPYPFQALHTGDYNSHQPLLFIRQPVAVSTVKAAGEYEIRIHPLQSGVELFWLRDIILEPIKQIPVKQIPIKQIPIKQTPVKKISVR